MKLGCESPDVTALNMRKGLGRTSCQMKAAPRDQQALLQADMVAWEMAGASRLAMLSATSSVRAAPR